MVAFVVEARRKYHPAKRSRLRPFRVPRRFPASSRRPIRIKLLGTLREEGKVPKKERPSKVQFNGEKTQLSQQFAHSVCSRRSLCVAP